MTRNRQQQLIYLAADLLSAEVVWLCFLWFRWLVFDGRLFDAESILFPAFHFYPPLIAYPLICVCIYYLSGFYLRPFRKRYGLLTWRTLLSTAVASFLFFFIIIIDDPTTDYRRYIVALVVLFLLQFFLTLLPRLLITSLSRNRIPYRVRTIHTLNEANRLHKGDCEEVIIDMRRENPSEQALFRIINALYPLDVEIAVVPRLYDMLTGAARISDIEGEPLVRITDHKMSDAGLCIKRGFDVVMSATVMILLSPLYLVLTVLVATTSRGSVFYSQERIGMHARPFRILKFRTMYTNAEAATPLLSSDHDPRITPVGHVLRKYRLDELPQMWNIFRGDMSFVGPRPEREYFIRQIVARAPYYCLLYKIRPGMTSWGPVRVGYTDTLDKMVARLNYDITYMENMSLALDCKILFFTIGVIFDGKGK